MNQLLQGEPMLIFGDGTQMRAFTHIDDVAPIIAGSVHARRHETRYLTWGPICPIP